MAIKRKSKLGPPYSSPPIFECVMELRFQDAPRSRFVERAARRIEGYYDHSHTDRLVNFEVTIVEGSVETNSTEPSPLIKLSSNDQTDTCTLSIDKIYWTGLAPYKGWNEFVGRIERDLAALTKDVGQRALSRIGLRYRNRIDVPIEQPTQICRYEDFLEVKINLPDLLDPTSGFEWRLSKEFPELKLAAVIMSSVMQPVIPFMGAFLLDIDIFAHNDVRFDRTYISEILAKMRNLKNEIFESSITDVARESFS